MEYFVLRITETIKTSKSYLFFEFVENFVRGLHSQFTLNNLTKYITALVQRILNELEVVNAKSKSGKTLDLSKGKVSSGKNNGKTSKAVKNALQRIGKMINVVRYIVELDYFSGRFIPVIEEAIKPLLLLMMDPA